jgi:hypothetical protein
LLPIGKRWLPQPRYQRQTTFEKRMRLLNRSNVDELLSDRYAQR